MNTIIGHNSNGILVAGDGVSFSNFKDIIQVDNCLRNCVIMIINTVCQFAVIVEHEPAPLPSLGAVNRVSKVPVGRDKQVSAFGDDSGGLIDLQSLI